MKCTELGKEIFLQTKYEISFQAKALVQRSKSSSYLSKSLIII